MVICPLENTLLWKSSYFDLLLKFHVFGIRFSTRLSSSTVFQLLLECVYLTSKALRIKHNQTMSYFCIMLF